MLPRAGSTGALLHVNADYIHHRVAGAYRGGIDALPARCAGHRAADFGGGEKPVSRQPDCDGGQLFAHDDAVGLSV